MYMREKSEKRKGKKNKVKGHDRKERKRKQNSMACSFVHLMKIAQWMHIAF